MKILIICSKRFYDNIPNIKKELIKNDIEVFLPNCYDDPATEERMWHLGKDKHQEFKAKMYKQSEDTIKNMDAVLVLNFDKIKNGKVLSNYIGASTFLEIYEASMNNKKVYLMNPIPDNLLYEEIKGCGVEVINCDLNKLKEEI